MVPAPLAADGALRIAPALAAACAAAGIARVADVLARARLVRDLSDRSNHELVLGGVRLFVKRTKPRGLWRRAPNPPPEAAALARLAAAGVPCARVALEGVDPRLGALTATFDLAPARALDQLLALPALEGGLPPASQAAVFAALVRVVARLHDAGLALRDLYANQVYVDPARASVTLLDAERLVAHGGGLNRWVVKDLAGLGASLPVSALSEAARGRLIARYIHTRNLPLRRSLGWLGPRVRRKSERIRAHVPRTPVGAVARPPVGAR